MTFFVTSTNRLLAVLHQILMVSSRNISRPQFTWTELAKDAILGHLAADSRCCGNHSQHPTFRSHVIEPD